MGSDDGDDVGAIVGNFGDWLIKEQGWALHCSSTTGFSVSWHAVVVVVVAEMVLLLAALHCTERLRQPPPQLAEH